MRHNTYLIAPHDFAVEIDKACILVRSGVAGLKTDERANLLIETFQNKSRKESGKLKKSGK